MPKALFRPSSHHILNGCINLICLSLPIDMLKTTTSNPRKEKRKGSKPEYLFSFFAHWGLQPLGGIPMHVSANSSSSCVGLNACDSRSHRMWWMNKCHFKCMYMLCHSLFHVVAVRSDCGWWMRSRSAWEISTSVNECFISRLSFVDGQYDKTIRQKEYLDPNMSFPNLVSIWLKGWNNFLASVADVTVLCV